MWLNHGRRMKNARSMKKVKPVPGGYYTVTPYLARGEAAQAIAFYKKAFGAKDVLRIPGRAERSATPKSALATRRGGSRCICMSRCFASTRSSSAPSRQTPRWDRIGNVQGTPLVTSGTSPATSRASGLASSRSAPRRRWNTGVDSVLRGLPRAEKAIAWPEGGL